MYVFLWACWLKAVYFLYSQQHLYTHTVLPIVIFPLNLITWFTEPIILWVGLVERPVVNSEQKWLCRTETRTKACVIVHRGRDPLSALACSLDFCRHFCEVHVWQLILKESADLNYFICVKDVELHLQNSIQNKLSFCNMSF